MYRFSAYPATQYYVLERRVAHISLEAEGGTGLTYDIVSGPSCFARKDWRIIAAFFAFDLPMCGSTKYTVYYRKDPFPRIIIAVGPITRPEEWIVKFSFYAFDTAVPGTCVFGIHHCIRSIHSIAASLSRHRITLEDARMPWEFRMTMYAFPVAIADISLVNFPPVPPRGHYH